jgi:hypothetical protein
LYYLAKIYPEFYSEQKATDAHAYKVRIEAEARSEAAGKDAEALLVRQQKEAAGMSAMAGAYADLSRAFSGPAGLIQYLMIEKGIYTQLAKANADAVRGLNPKMTIWNTGKSFFQGFWNNNLPRLRCSSWQRTGWRCRRFNGRC